MADIATSQVGNVYHFDLSAAGRSNIRIEVENIPSFQYPGRRQKRLWGVVGPPGPAPQRDRSLLPLSVDDEELWEVLKEGSFEGGHLVGLKYGGPDHEVNITPLSHGANSGSGTWGDIEKAIGAHWQAQNGNQTVQLDLDILYNDAVDPRIPYHVKGWVGQVAAGVVQARTAINTYVHPPRDQTNCLIKPISDALQAIEAAAQARGSNTLVATPRAPNAPLDILDFNNPVSAGLRTAVRAAHPLLADYPLSGIRKTRGGRVQRSQRLLLLLYNRYRNRKGPQRTAILTAEDEDNLGLILSEWQAQHDHIQPRSRGGTNKYANLILTHHRVNNRRGNRPVSTRHHLKRVRKQTIRFGY